MTDADRQIQFRRDLTENLEVSQNREGLACDVTHYDGRPYLSIIDCGPRRLAFWKVLENETVQHLVDRVVDVFRERGTPAELLLQKAISFKPLSFVDACERWVAELFTDESCG